MRRAFPLHALWVGCQIIQENIHPTRHQHISLCSFQIVPFFSQQGDACLSSRIELGPPWMRIWCDGYALHEPCRPPVCPGPQGQPSACRESHAAEERPLWLLSHSAGQINCSAHTLPSQNSDFTCHCTSCIGLTRTRGWPQERDSKPLIAIVIRTLFNLIFSNETWRHRWATDTDGVRIMTRSNCCLCVLLRWRVFHPHL